MKYQVDQLQAINETSNEKLQVQLDKVAKKKAKIARERALHQEERDTTVTAFQSRIIGLERELKRLHGVYDDYKDVTEGELILKDGIIHKFTSKVEEYRDQQRNIKAILRIPRLCAMYQDNMKVLSENEENQLLEDLYNSYFCTKREAEQKT